MTERADPLSEAPTAWGDALQAAAMLAVDPAGLGGIHVRARAGPVRDRFLREISAQFGSGIATRRIAAGTSEARLTGGLDIGATLAAGRKVVETGVLAAADGGLIVLAMAERLPSASAAVIAAALDERQVRIERDGLSARQPAGFALIALDEGVDEDEKLIPLIADRLGLSVDLGPVGWRESEPLTSGRPVAAARALLPAVTMDEAMVEALCGLATSFGRMSLRTSLHLCRAARAAAALAGRTEVAVEDATLAARLVLGLGAASAPPAASEDRASDQPEDPPPRADAAGPDDTAGEEPQRPESPDRREDDPASDEQEEPVMPTAEHLQQMLIAAVAAALPADLLAGQERSAGRSRGEAGKAGAERRGGARGRAFGIADKPPQGRARIDVLATLRQAAPWQRLRGREILVGAGAETGEPPRQLQVRAQDFRYIRRREKTGTTAIFAVDASGSTALERLAETKGAIELLLAQCYVRRDSVALVAFRGRQAETLLEPTRSLLRAKRSLSALPGGGGTPLPGGIIMSLRLALAATRRGQSVISVFLTDGRGNVALDGSTERARVDEDTGRAARQFRGAGIRALLIDTAQRPQARAVELARALGAEYLPLPRAGSGAMAREVGARMET
ncbi:Mg-protoporphyrin IX chelatase [Aureimonas sp. SA4125]|uniref:magnesium chelatase subunit D n=1 Tax=Aureimonas sp. SA4125 TaxID=2826993 RepID=UPI001CC68AEC|nr:magnesium chelatase subunit D [Aureimonas sp. SA4125]BDA85240.1 Mg-protoporphyrin IX chelatase [Aureimonas sp. SA4125]